MAVGPRWPVCCGRPATFETDRLELRQKLVYVRTRTRLIHLESLQEGGHELRPRIARRAERSWQIGGNWFDSIYLRLDLERG